ncbi:MAG: urea ABC transporter ATP-binding protein UrtD [Succinivibrio sp.]|nr:urea ABC transporter ATP-binding protein UrtD [Succinivibrio sp.]
MISLEKQVAQASLKLKNLAQKSHLAHKHRQQPPARLKKQDIVLYVENLTVSFDGFKALNDLTFYLNSGELRCFIGPNGAGKSTMMDVLTGKTKVDSGSAWFVPDPGDPNPSHMLNLLEMDEVSIANAGIGRKFQKPSVFETLSVAQNLELALSMNRSVFKTYRSRLNGEQQDFMMATLEKIRLSSLANALAASLSHGQKQWLEIGMLLMQKPSLIMLDEPVAGMTPEEIEMTIALLHELKGQHTIMVVEHDMDFIRAIANQVVVLNQGTVLAEGNMDSIQSDPRVIKAYLGEGL